jgi:hypothetical protein
MDVVLPEQFVNIGDACIARHTIDSCTPTDTLDLLSLSLMLTLAGRPQLRGETNRFEIALRSIETKKRRIIMNIGSGLAG